MIDTNNRNSSFFFKWGIFRNAAKWNHKKRKMKNRGRRSNADLQIAILDNDVTTTTMTTMTTTAMTMMTLFTQSQQYSFIAEIHQCLSIDLMYIGFFFWIVGFNHFAFHDLNSKMVMESWRLQLLLPLLWWSSLYYDCHNTNQWCCSTNNIWYHKQLIIIISTFCVDINTGAAKPKPKRGDIEIMLLLYYEYYV